MDKLKNPVDENAEELQPAPKSEDNYQIFAAQEP